MLNWKNWCRLCAGCEEQGEDILLNDTEVLETIKNYFGISVTEYTKMPRTICSDCRQFLLKINQFSQRSAKAQSMFYELLVSTIEHLSDECFWKIREKYSASCISSSNYNEDNGPNQVTTSYTDLALTPKEEVISLPEDEEIIVDDDIKYEFDLNETDSWENEDMNTYNSNKDELEQSDNDTANHEESNKRTRFSERLLKTDFPCKSCDSIWPSEKILSQHYKIEHPTFKLKKKKPTARNPSKNTAKKSVPNKKSFMCEDCGKTCQSNASLTEHRTIHTEDRPFQCTICSKRFKYQRRLKIHMDVHSSGYLCLDCGQKLRTKELLRRHQVVHSDEKKYNCPHCSSSFKRAKTLKAHIITHTGERPWACPWCDKTFACGANCRKHKLICHPKELKELEATGCSTDNVKLPKLESLLSVRSH